MPGRVSETTASAAVLRTLGLTVFAVARFGVEDVGGEDGADLDNTGAVRDHFLSLYRNAESRRLAAILGM
ncbi:MAG: hypothetical protein NTAFB05_23450 [Nitrobacter sp.]